ncbi:Hypothetical protein PHPALM_15700 [Phytophthora palmivora]|uniref:Uncharacterized protein n=1 Tax=Phytophthora palmivora TaxID=4796 RepID=A0A2P4XRK1_9STRA|nr:Hypothetical protein PHPALM_15700 [Phytophthora palmivora]
MAPPPAADSHGSERKFRRHQELMQMYSTSTRRSASIASTTSSITPHNGQASQSDLAVLKQKFQFIRDDEADAEAGEMDWQVRMSVRYYRQLFREYALADLSRYKEGKVGLRWRTEMEVIAGKGQFSCGNKSSGEKSSDHDVGTEDIHELCAKINEEQKAAYPTTSQGGKRENVSCTRSSGYEELLP